MSGQDDHPDSTQESDKARPSALLLDVYRSDVKSSVWFDGVRCLAGVLLIATLVGVTRYLSLAKVRLSDGSFRTTGPADKLEFWIEWIAACWCIWVVGPPTWFGLEYFYLFDRSVSDSKFGQFKYGQEITAKAWATLVIVLGTFLYKSFK